MPDIQLSKGVHGRVQILGSGVAARACQLALSRLGWASSVSPLKIASASGPTLVLNDVCLALLAELVPGLDLLAMGRALSLRVVKWGRSEASRLRVSSVVVDSGALLAELQACAEGIAGVHGRSLSQNWTVLAGPRLGQVAAPDPRMRLSSGGRYMVQFEVELCRADALEAYFVESVEDGWLMLTPSPQDVTRGALQMSTVGEVGEADLKLESLLRKSELVGPRIRVLSAGHAHASAPVVRAPLVGRPADRWLSVGSSAATLDPLSGEGCPFALRSALLAAAVIDAGATGSVPVSQALDHMQHRLALTLDAHLRNCETFYEQAFSDHSAWKQEFAASAELRARLEQLFGPIDASLLQLEMRAAGLQPRA